jgi:hypothetical protein
VPRLAAELMTDPFISQIAVSPVLVCRQTMSLLL